MVLAYVTKVYSKYVHMYVVMFIYLALKNLEYGNSPGNSAVGGRTDGEEKKLIIFSGY